MEKLIKELPIDLQLITDSQDVESIKHHVGPEAEECDGFLVRVEDGDYAEIWGFYGNIPWKWKSATLLYPVTTPTQVIQYLTRMQEKLTSTTERDCIKAAIKTVYWLSQKKEGREEEE